MLQPKMWSHTHTHIRDDRLYSLLPGIEMCCVVYKKGKYAKQKHDTIIVYTVEIHLQS